jgi:hypothetical protein
MAYNPAYFGFSAEYKGDHPAYDDFDDYLRIEFANRHPGWEANFGRKTQFDPEEERYDHLYLVTGSVPEARSHEEAESKLRQLLDEIGRGLKSLRPRSEKPLPEPVTKVWRREDPRS